MLGANVQNDLVPAIERPDNDVGAIRAYAFGQRFFQALRAQPEAFVLATGLGPGVVDRAAFAFVTVLAPGIGRFFQLANLHCVTAVGAIPAIVGHCFMGRGHRFRL